MSLYDDILIDTRGICLCYEVLRNPDDKPTLGLLLVKGKNETTVRYSLGGYANPIGVAEWEQQIAGSLPEDVLSSLPTIEDIPWEEGRASSNSRRHFAPI